MELSQREQQNLLRKLQVFNIRGFDRLGRPLLLVVGKLFPARLVGVEAVKKFLDADIFPVLRGKPYSLVYIHTGFDRHRNFPGLAALGSLYDAIPDTLAAVYFLHPGLLSRLFLHLLLFWRGRGRGVRVEYVSRLGLLWSKVMRSKVEIPEFVYQYEEELERRPMGVIDYGLESDHPRLRTCEFSTYSTRRIA